MYMHRWEGQLDAPKHVLVKLDAQIRIHPPLKQDLGPTYIDQFADLIVQMPSIECIGISLVTVSPKRTKSAAG